MKAILNLETVLFIQDYYRLVIVLLKINYSRNEQEKDKF